MQDFAAAAAASSFGFHDETTAFCPCPRNGGHRFLADDDEDYKTWHLVFTTMVLVLMIGAFVIDLAGADSIMVVTLTSFMAAKIITIKEGLAGFANEGVLTVLALFVVAEGIQKTGGLDWYMPKLLGHPKTMVGAQLRLMIPVTIVSAFLNNTPIVVVMSPVVLRWAKHNRMSPKQLLIPLSFAVVLGGTCTIIGTSTNLVVKGLFNDRYGDTDMSMSTFDLALYGVPNALAGLAYMVLFATFLLPGDTKTNVDEGNLLFPARVTQWSPAAGRTVHRSGLRDEGGIFLVSVKRAATGNIHRAVSRDFVLNVGDVLYFTGLVEAFGQFCAEHGLEVVSNETEETGDNMQKNNLISANSTVNVIGVTKQSLLDADEQERLRAIHKMSDEIRDFRRSEESGVFIMKKTEPELRGNDPAQILVAVEQDLVIVGVNTKDRPGLLLDISKTLLRLKLELRHTEAAVMDDRSFSIWRTKTVGTEQLDVEGIWTVLSALLSDDAGIEAIKKRGLQVVRAKVPPESKLIGWMAAEIDFRKFYKAAFVAGPNTDDVTKRPLVAGDIIVLQVSDDSPLLIKPPAGFYEHHKDEDQSLSLSRSTDNSSSDPEAQWRNDSEAQKKVWKDLHVLFPNESAGAKSAKEFLTVMSVAPNSQLTGKNAIQLGLRELPGLFLVCIERPCDDKENNALNRDPASPRRNLVGPSNALKQAGPSPQFAAVSEEEPLQDGDILWFSGSASAVAELRKIPGLDSYEKDEVEKMHEKVHERRLVQAVIAQNGELVGKTVREVRFRSRFGAAVIAVQREGKPVHEHPGRVKLRAGDVLLLEAGPTFLTKNSESSNAFALLSEVEDSAPPRLRLLIPAVIIIVAMLVVYTTERIESLLIGALIASVVMISIGLLSEKEARAAINWQVYITVATSFGIGTAMENSGLADKIATVLVDIGHKLGMGDAGLFGAVYFATLLIGQVVQNNAVAALTFPFAMAAAEKAGADIVLMCFNVMLAASACYASPFGYTTNLIVYGAGGYKAIDFFKFGAPMQIYMWIMATLFLVVIRPWYVSWIATGILFAVVAGVRLAGSSLSQVSPIAKQK